MGWRTLLSLVASALVACATPRVASPVTTGCAIENLQRPEGTVDAQWQTRCGGHDYECERRSGVVRCRTSWTSSPASATAADGPPSRNAPPGKHQSTPDETKVIGVIRANQRDVIRCYEQALYRDDSTAGRLELILDLTGPGALRNVGIGVDTVGDEQMRVCVLSVVKTWTFPPLDDPFGVTLKYPFIFSASRLPGSRPTAPKRKPGGPT